MYSTVQYRTKPSRSANKSNKKKKNDEQKKAGGESKSCTLHEICGNFK